MRKLLSILTAILSIFFLIACSSKEDVEMIVQENKMVLSETTHEEYEVQPMQEEVVEKTTETFEEYIKFSYDIIKENDLVQVIILKFEGKNTIQATCISPKEVESTLEKINCKSFIVDNQGTEIYFTKGQIVAVLKETFEKG